LAHGRMRNKRAALEQALTGRVRDHHRYLIAQHLVHLDFLDEQIDELEQQNARMIAADAPTDVPPACSRRLSRGSCALLVIMVMRHTTRVS
jgi:hypothetical protein